jgi:outer membrane immunogenic protein
MRWSRVMGWEFSMKRILLAAALALAAGGQALAADLPQPEAPPPPRAPATYVPVPVPVFTWSGIYLGVNGGYAFGTSDWSTPGLTTGNFNTSGYLVGGTLGGNYQWNQFVLGIEGDGDWTTLTGTTFTNCVGGCTTKSDWLATVRGRVGYAFDRILIYGTGGGAFGNLQAANGALPSPFSSSTQIGWTGGGGVEFAFTPNLTAKVEYLYVNLGSQSCAIANCAGPAVATVPLTENVVRAGLNYKFW